MQPIQPLIQTSQVQTVRPIQQVLPPQEQRVIQQVIRQPLNQQQIDQGVIN